MKKLMVLIASLALVAGFAMTAAAADWNFYGSARVATFFVDSELADTTDYNQGMQGNSRIGANVKVSDELTGRFEYGTVVNVRILWGEWNFGGGSLGVGQHYTPLNMFYSNQVFGSDNDMLGQGGVYSGRQSMIRLKFGDFQIAATDTNAVDLAGTGTEIDFPAIEVSYALKMDAVSISLAGGYQSYELQTVNEDVDSWVIALGAKANFGAAYIGGNVYTGTNAGHMIGISVDGDNGWGDGFAAWDAVNNKVLDNDAFGFMLAAGFKANDMFSFEAGYGHAETELDGAASDDQVNAYYVQSTITLAPGVYIIPEIGLFDGEETGSEETTYYGAKWQINF